MSIYEGKRVLVTGGTGMIGRPLVQMLLDQGARVRIASLDDPARAHPDTEFFQRDLTDINNCLEVAADMDFVFQLAGVKGSPKMCAERPASFFVPTILFNTNMMEAAHRSGIKKYLYTSTIGVYSPAEVFYEDDVWKTFPSPNDRFAGWAKRMGELQAEAYAIEHGWKDISIVRPANVYGPYDNFNLETCMVVPALIRRVLDGENPLNVWGDGSSVRDFVFTDDVARGILFAMEHAPGQVLNLGSGTRTSVKELVEIIRSLVDEPPEVHWDTSQARGDNVRVMDMSRAEGLGFRNQVSLREGIKKTMDWYLENRELSNKDTTSFWNPEHLTGYEPTKTKILICGGTGFIGRNLVNRLSQNEQYEIHATHFNREPYDVSNTTFHHADLTKKEDVHRVMEGMDIVIQAAATTSGANEIKKTPFFHVTDNAVMNAWIFRAAADLGIKQVFFFSCTIIYQSNDNPIKESDLDLNEEMHPNYFGPGWTKLYNEKMGEFYSRFSDTKFTMIRHSNIYGPFDKFDPGKSHVFAATLLKVMGAKDKIVVWGDGSEERDLLHVDDLIDFIEKAFDQKEPFGLYNVGAGNMVSITNLAKTMIELSGKSIEIEYDSSKPSFKNKYCVDCTNAKNDFGWVPKIELKDGISSTMSWVKENVL